MKLRFKYDKRFLTASFNDTNPSINKIIESAAEKYDLNATSIELSLNAKDYFKLSENILQSNDIGIVNGDIIYVKLIGDYVDIKNVFKEEISVKLETIISETGTNFPSPLLKKISLPIHLCMTETGFMIDNFNKNFIENIDNNAMNYVCRFKYDYINHESTSINLTIVLNNSYISVYGSYCNSPNIYKFHFKSKQFIMQNNFDNTTHEAENIYKNLMLFSTRFKNLVSIPLRIDIHMDYSIASHPFFQILPFEILSKIYGYLDRKSLLAAMTTCKRLNLAGKMTRSIWKKSLLKTSLKNSLNETEQDLDPCCLYERYLTFRKENTLKKRTDGVLSMNFRNPVYL